MKNKFITALVSAGLVFTMSMTVIAAPSIDDLNNRTSDLRNKQSENQKQIDSMSKQIKDLESSIESYDNQISNMTVKLNDTKSKISSTQAKIDKAQGALKKAQDDYNAQQNLLNDRIKVIYVNGSQSYASFLLDSKGLGDFISRIETVKQISQLDKKVMSDLEAQQSEISEQKKTLDTQKEELVKLQSDQQSTLDKLNSEKSKEAAVVADYNKKQNTLLSTNKQYQTEINDNNEAVKKIQADAQKLSNTTNIQPTLPIDGKFDNTKGAQIFAYACKYLGVPYQWGGTTPNGFDCSGFTQYVYAYFGIHLPRVSEDQCKVGTRVSRSQLQMGDLVFFMDSTGDVHHVGIYYKDGYYINAPHSGDVVKISPLNSDFCYGTRVVK